MVKSFISISITSIALTVFVVGCTHYGGNLFPMNLTRLDNNPNTIANYYLIPDQVWTEYGKTMFQTGTAEDIQETKDRLVQYKIPEDGKVKVDAIKYDVIYFDPHTKSVENLTTFTPDQPNQSWKIPAPSNASP